MNKKHYIIALLICLALLISACKKSGAAAGTAPRTPFIGGTAGITLGFEKDNPPPEVTDDGSFAFNAIVRLKNDGEARVARQNVRLNLVGFDPGDFRRGTNFDDVRNKFPENSLEPRRRDAEGSIIEGTTTFATFPDNSDVFIPNKFAGNTEFTFRAEACYNYETFSSTKLCILRDMINVRDTGICKPNGAKTVYSSSAPVQVANLKQSVVGRDKISFTFDIILSGNVDIFWNDQGITPASNGEFDAACPKEPRARRERENTVGVEITEIPRDPIVKFFRCGGLDRNGNQGVVRLINRRRTITCTAELIEDRLDLEKAIGINLIYNVLDGKETKVLVKHLIDS